MRGTENRKRTAECPVCRQLVGVGNGPGPLVRHLRGAHGIKADEARERAGVAFRAPARSDDLLRRVLAHERDLEALQASQVVPNAWKQHAAEVWGDEISKLLAALGDPPEAS